MYTIPTPDPQYPTSAQAPAIQPVTNHRSHTALAVGIAVVVLLALLGGGFLAVRSAEVATTPAKANTKVAVPAVQLPQTDDVSTTIAGADVPTAADIEVAVPQTPNNGAPAGNPGGGSNTGGGTSGGGNGSPSSNPTPAPPTPPAPSVPAPVITSFVTPDDIDCHNGPSQTFSATWTTTNAVKTTISIDGPGVYKTYAANDADSLPFSCSSSHTFLLTAFGQDGSTTTMSITLQPRNVQVPGPDDEDL